MTLVNNKQELLSLLAKSRSRLEDMITKIPPGKLEQAGVNGVWAGKDVLTHISAWEEYQIGWMDAVLNGEKPDVPGPGLTFGEQDIDRFNRQIFEDHCRETTHQVLDRFHSIHERFIAQIEAMPEEILVRPGFASFTGPKRALTAWYTHFAFHDGWAAKILYYNLVRKPRKSK